MGATVGTMMMRGAKSGRKYAISLYHAGGDAVGTYVLMDWNSPAAATSPNFMTVPELVDVVDFIPTSATGQVEFTSDGMRTSVVLNYAAFTAASAGRPVQSLPRLQPGKTYRLLVVVALAA